MIIVEMYKIADKLARNKPITIDEKFRPFLSFESSKDFVTAL